MKLLKFVTLMMLLLPAVTSAGTWVNHPLTKYELNEEYGHLKIYTPSYDYIVLDCMSFSNELRIYSQGSIERRARVSIYECEEIQERIKESIDRNEACLKIDIDENQFEFQDSKCEKK